MEVVGDYGLTGTRARGPSVPLWFQRLPDDLFDKAGLQANEDVVHLAGDFVVTIDEANRSGFGADFEDVVGAFEFQIFDHGDDVSIDEDVAVGVFDHAVGVCGLWGGFEGPLVATGDALVPVSMVQNLTHLTHGARGIGHVGTSRVKGVAVREEEGQNAF